MIMSNYHYGGEQNMHLIEDVGVIQTKKVRDQCVQLWMMVTKAYSNPLFEMASTSVGSEDSIILKVAIMSSRR